MDPAELGMNSYEMGGLFVGAVALTLMMRCAMCYYDDKQDKSLSNEELLKHLELIKRDLADLRQMVSQLQLPNTFVFETETDSESSEDNEEALEEELEQEQPEEVHEQTTAPVTGPTDSNLNDAKHAQLRQKMKDGNELYLSYKKTTFVGKYVVKADSPNGYVIQHNGVDYLTPSQFSFKMKRSVNPSISSDNGWDSIHVLNGLYEKGKPVKMSLKNFINTA